MGRSKFPGKPSKHVNKQRVNVLSCSTNSPDSKSSITENILIQLPSGIAPSLTNSKQCSPVSELSKNSIEGEKPKSTIKRTERNVTTARIPRIQRNFDRRVRSSKSKRDVELRLRAGEKTVGAVDRKLERFKSSEKRNASSLAGKFVLPKRSVHSSRVIKPNKRFVDGESKYSPPRRPRGRPPGDGASEERRRGTDSSRVDRSKPPTIDRGGNVADISVNSRSPSPQLQNRLVLREAKLRLRPVGGTSSSGLGTSNEGPFSSCVVLQQGHAVPPGTVTCGVCGAVRFYRFVKQARKFNIYSCESCRKFISKMMKRRACHRSGTAAKLVCHGGRGVCHVPPIVRSQQWKLIRCAYKARCPACWLKMCLRSFKMPASLESSLAEMLPDNMRGVDGVLIESVQNEVADFSSERMTGRFDPRSSVSKFGSAFSFLRTAMPPSRFLEGRSVDILNKHPERRKRGMRAREKTNVNDSSTISTGDKTIRQKLDLRGPRVKHVCRSASIVLGQPVATFRSIRDTTKSRDSSLEFVQKRTERQSLNESSEILSRNSEESLKDGAMDRSRNRTDVSNRHNSDASRHQNESMSEFCGEQKCDGMTSEVELLERADDSQSEEKSCDGYRRRRTCVTTGNGRRFAENKSSMYDLTEIREHGFGLLVSKDITLGPLCFLCGSAGQSQLVHCSLCCEPYHPFCAGTGTEELFEKEWMCLRCTATCAACSAPAPTTIVCVSCRRMFHTRCLVSECMVCLTCNSCSICGSSKVCKIVGRTPFCSDCFCTKYDIETCPCCEKGFNSSADTKVIECSECQNLYHITCENISEEQFTMLRTMPVYTRFVCYKCSSLDGCLKPSWQSEIKSRLVAGCLSVLRSLVERRVSPKKPEIRGSISTSDTNNGKELKHNECTGKAAGDLIESSSMIRKRIGSVSSCDISSISEKKCSCTEVLTLLEVKRKIVSKDYDSVLQFRHDLDLAIRGSGWNELLGPLDDIIYKAFPWFKRIDHKRVSCDRNDALLDVTKQCRMREEFVCKSNVNSKNKSKCSSTKSNFEDVSESDREDSDARICVLCSVHGDVIGMKGGRLLFCEADMWIHVACALWSVGIHETLDGALLGVAATVCRARHVTCRACGLPGATVDCSARACCSTYHFPCAVVTECRFFGNYRVRCAEHPASPDERELDLEEFDVARPVYVHVDTKRRVTNSRAKLQFIVGSLVVSAFGSYAPVVSDYDDLIIPTGMKCTRLFWSTVEPWRIVRYTITSSVVIPRSAIDRSEFEKNITFDHFDDVDKKTETKKRFYDDATADTDGTIRSRDISGNLIETVCPREIYESEEEPQNGTDILPPEIKDAIFEDLPHDVLDGISMQDIFPKLMSYDDPLSGDLKNESCYRDEVIRDREDINDSDRSSDVKKVDVRSDRREILVEKDSDRGLKRSKSEVLGFSAVVPLSDTGVKDRSHRRSCSLAWSCKFNNSSTGLIKKRKISCVTPNIENFSSIADNSKSHSIDSIDCTGIDSRLEIEGRCVADIAKIKGNITVLRRKFLQVDGVNDLSSSEDEELENTSFITEDSDSRYRSQKYRFEDEEGDVDAPVKCQRCQCTYRTPDSYSRHLSNCETLSTSESDSETLIDSENYANIGETVISSTSVTEIIEKPSDSASQEFTFIDSRQLCFRNDKFTTERSGQINITNGIVTDCNTNGSSCVSYTNSSQDTCSNVNPLLPSTVIVPHRSTVLPLSDPGEKLKETSDLIIQQDRFSIDSNVADLVPVILDTANIGTGLCDNRDSLSSLIVQSSNISSDMPRVIDTTNFVIRSDRISNTMPKVNEIPPLVVRPRQLETNSSGFVVSNSSGVAEGLFTQQDGISTSVMYGTTPQATRSKIVVPVKRKPEPIVRPVARNRGRPVTSRRPLLSKQIRVIEKRPYVETPSQVRTTNVACTPATFVIQPQPVPKQHTYFVQSLGGLPNSLATAYTQDTLHPSLTTQGVQYLIAPNSVDCGGIINNQFVAPNPLLPTATFQIHSGLDPSVNLISIPTNSDVGLVSTISAPLVGTIVRPQPLTGAIECGLVSTEQLVLNTAPTIQPSAQTCVYLGGQPLYYGLETVVQNTVMSTQQFMSTVLPGQVLAQNSSFSATTQVFQTSTIHEQPAVLDVQDTRNCVLITPQTPKPQGLTRTDALTGICTPHTSFTTIEPRAADVATNYTIRPVHGPPQQHQRVQQIRMTPVPRLETDKVDEMTFVVEPVNISTDLVHSPTTHRPVPFTRKSINCTPSALVQPHTTHITLPVAPNQPQGIPTNIVPPTPHVKSPTQKLLQKPQRPMNRVLPMTASPVQEEKEDILQKAMKFMRKSSCSIYQDDSMKEKSMSKEILEQNIVCDLKPTEVEKKITSLVEDTVEKKSDESHHVYVNIPDNKTEAVHKEHEEDKYAFESKIENKRRADFESTSLKFVFRKQTEEGVYEISDKKLSELRDEKSNDSSSKTIRQICSLSMPSLDEYEKPDRNVEVQDQKSDIKANVPFINGQNETVASEVQKKTHRIRSDFTKKHLKNHYEKSKDKKSRILFRVQSQDGFTYTSTSLAELWQKVLSSVQESRLAHSLPPLPSNTLNEYQILGLKNPSLKFILEEMRRTRLANVKKEDNDIIGESSPGGAARCTPFSGHRSKHDAFSWLASCHRKLEFTRVIDGDSSTRLSNPRVSSINLPVVTRYRNLKETSKKSVGVYRSSIHGRGLFCLRDIELGEMVIEYAGEVIRSSMTDMREKYYNSKGIGCYMFRIDDNLVVDATVKGNAARFINHSCDPNCYSRVLEILGHKHILIFALRRILQGEELTYDYKFPFEEDKIPCTCGARRCRKYLN